MDSGGDAVGAGIANYKHGGRRERVEEEEEQRWVLSCVRMKGSLSSFGLL